MHYKKFASMAAIFAAAIAVFATANFAQGADNDLIITEMMYDPIENSDEEKTEWIELYANSDVYIGPKSVSCTADWCQLKDFYICTKNGCSASYASPFYSPSNKLEVSKGEIIILAKDPEIFRKTYSDKNGLLILKAGSNFNLLENENGFVAISEDNKSSWIEEIEYGKFSLQQSKGHSLEKIDLLAENTKENWQESCEEDGTPGEEPQICESESDSSSKSDEISNPPIEDSIEASTSNDDETGASEKTYLKNLKITELLPNPSANEDSGEFTELFNADSKEAVDLSGWKLEDKGGNSLSLPSVSIEPGEYRAFYRNKSSFSLNNSGEEIVFLKNPLGEIVDQVSYSGTVKEDFACALKDGEFQWTSSPTPGEENMIDSDPETDSPAEIEDQPKIDDEESFSNAEEIFLNEILPNPKKNSDDEYIEIANNGNDSVDLLGWTIRDGSKNGKYVFKESAVIEPNGYLVIYRPQSKLSLNNTTESLTSFSPQGEIISNVSWETSQKNASYNFDGENWRWSKYLTPGEENEFDSEPSVKITKPKHSYKNLFTEFSVKAKDKETKKLKFSWDFGDGKKSSLEDPTHKYLDTGKYEVTLSVTDDSQIIEKSFSIQVKKYPRPKIEIVKIVPNPAGNDTEGEIVEVRNNSSKKIGLADWKIATDSGENTYNHPIIGEINLGPNETKTITREFSKFSLNNKAGKVSLVLPDGKIADAVEYAKEKIAEGEAYAKMDGQWKWLDPNAQDESAISEDSSGEDGASEGEVLGAADESAFVSPSRNSRFTSEDAYIFLSRINFLRTIERKMTYRPASNPSSNIAYLIASLI